MLSCGCGGVCGTCSAARSAAFVNGPSLFKPSVITPIEIDEYEPVEGIGDDLLSIASVIADPYGLMPDPMKLIRDNLEPSPEVTASFEAASAAWKVLKPLLNDPKYPDRKMALDRLAEWEAFEKDWREGRRDPTKLNSMIGLLNGIQRDFNKPLIGGFDIENMDVLTKAAVDLGQTGLNQDKALISNTAMLVAAVGAVGLLGLGLFLGSR